jgi:integrase/recombinase XerD
MRDERGFTPSTVEQWGRTTRRFLRWCAEAGRQLGDLTACDIDNYVATQGKSRWTRVSTANMVSALRAFLRYAAKEGWCSNRLAESISRPRLYHQESLPYAPDWSAVQQMLADVDTNKPRDIRDRAILLLLALYGMRSGEVAALRLDQIDWAGRTLRLVRLKRRQPLSSATRRRRGSGPLHRHRPTAVILPGSVPLHASVSSAFEGGQHL